MIKPVAIAKGAEQHPSLNFEFLRSAGIALIQQMAGKTWTDYNLHDPGITILEQLCYGITDLAYRTDFPIRDLLANEKGIIDYRKNSFFLKEDILTINPVTINDYRKVIIDGIDEIENVWLYPLLSSYSKNALHGLYRMVVQVRRETAEKLLSENKTNEDIIGLVRDCYMSKRNLCEDLVKEIIVLKPVQVTIEAGIQVQPQAMPEEVLAQIYHQLEKSLNQPVRYYTEKEMLEQGYTIDEIYSGPFLKKGFIPDRELNERKTLVDPTELIKTISQIDGVLSVKKLRIVDGRNEKYSKPYEIDEFSFPLLDIKSSEQHIKLYKDSFEVPVKRPVFRSILQKIRESEDRSFISSFYSSSKNLVKGKYRNNERYHSIQHQFPRIYGIGSEGLVADASDQRKAQAKQLKAYLLFFEQIMADYLSQLANISDVFSADVNTKGSSTYHNNPLYDVPGIQDLLKAYTARSSEGAYSWEAFKKDRNNGYRTALNTAAETDATYSDRKNRLFDHLFARFNEFITAYPVQLYSSLYESNSPEERVNSELKWKSDMLKNLAAAGSGRVRAVNYLKPDEESGDHIDFSSKMRMLLHISEDNSKTRLSSVLDDEHITIEAGARQSREKQESLAEEMDDSSWVGEIPRILLDEKEISRFAGQGRIEEVSDIPHDAFLFRMQDAGVLRHALNISNFRIGPDPLKRSGYITLYKAPSDEKWKVISRFSSHTSAMKSLKNLIGYIKNVSIRSEGFYLIEHILLRPELDGRNFGFRFIAKDGQRLMEHSRWMTFSEREEVMRSLLDILTGEDEITSEKLAPLCRINLYASPSEIPGSHPGNRPVAEGDNLFNYFRVYAAQKDKFLSRFEMVVRGEDNSMISEDFFSLRITVIFPSWPARFQDKNFREAAENLFRLNSPAHVKMHFVWLNVLSISRLEALYFDWKKFIAADDNKEIKDKLRNALIRMLYKYGAHQ